MVNILYFVKKSLKMEFIDFLGEMLGITKDFAVTKIEKNEVEKTINIYIEYIQKTYSKGGKEYSIYDRTPVRRWQHLNWFEYKCYLIGSLPRYVDKDGKPKVIDINFAPPQKGYTHLFAREIIYALKKVRVQSTVADLFNTTDYIVRSIMESAVEYGLEERGLVTDFKNVSLDEKAYTKGHHYATILMDSDKNIVLDMVEGRKEKDVKQLFITVSGNKKQPQITRVNMDMWRPFMNTIKEIAPTAIIVHDKFHLFKKLSEAIDKTRRKEVKDNPQLKNQKYTVLKNAENRTEAQQEAFNQLVKDNLKTSHAWLIRENFKGIFSDKINATLNYKAWRENALSYSITAVNKVIKTFDRHLEGILNAIITGTSSANHENKNGLIQSVIAKARGFRNFERFRINALFYFGKLNLIPQNI
ncbi:MAG: ISL3 family transposase [Ignavibacterium sp.]|nr:ISL3 family transposase [Ignavibacterium sp.]